MFNNKYIGSIWGFYIICLIYYISGYMFYIIHILYIWYSLKEELFQNK